MASQWRPGLIIDITKIPLLMKPPDAGDADNCRSPSYYSPDLRRCVAPSKKTVVCAYPMVKQGSTCVCASRLQLERQQMHQARW